MNAADLMTRNPAVVSYLDPLTRAAELMRERDVGMIPVVSDLETRTLCGVITDRDIVIRCVATGHVRTCFVGDHMTASPLAVVNIDDDLAVVLTSMERNHVRRLPVIDDRGAVIGVIAQADLARKVHRSDRLKVEQMLASLSCPVPTP